MHTFRLTPDEQAELSSAVRAANAHSRRRVALIRDDNQLITGAGSWVLLAALLYGTGLPPTPELEQAIGVPVKQAPHSVGLLARHLNSSDDVSMTAGIWTDAAARISPEFASSVPEVHVGSIPRSSAGFSNWVSNKALGLCPDEAKPTARIVAAAGTTSLATWAVPFGDTIGHWHNDDTFTWAWLARTTSNINDASVIDNRFSRVVCKTTGNLDVHLLSGQPEDTPGEILDAGISALDGVLPVTSASKLTPGDRFGALEIVSMRSFNSDGRLVLSLPRFDLECDQSLLNDFTEIGVSPFLTTSAGFLRVSNEPLLLHGAGESTALHFGSSGLIDSASNAASLRIAGRPPHEISCARVRHDRPFGVLVVDRRQALVITAGWVNRPTTPFEFRLTTAPDHDE